MVCERCGKAEALVFLRDSGSGGGERLCQSCASLRGIKSNADGSLSLDLDELLAEPGEYAKPGATCPRCGLGVSELKAGRRIGCPDCPNAFPEQFRALLPSVEAPDAPFAENRADIAPPGSGGAADGLPGGFSHASAGGAPGYDVIVRTRIVLGRNLAHEGFPWRQDERAASETAERVEKALRGDPSFETVPLGAANSDGRRLLVERGLLGDAYAFSSEARCLRSRSAPLVCALNDRDHADFVVELPGFRLREATGVALAAARALEAAEALAFDEGLGYLAPEPYRCGAVAEASVLLHLPGIQAAGLLDRTIRSAYEAGLEVLGRYSTEGASLGALYEFAPASSTRATVDHAGFSRVVSELADAERETRRRLLARDPDGFSDDVFRARGLVANARLLERDEAVEAAFAIRLGLCLGVVEGTGIGTWTDFLYTLGPAGLRASHGWNGEGRETAARARVLRREAERIVMKGGA